jgi:Carboxypeptidase regulatory-like domain/TonB dependent receptor
VKQRKNLSALFFAQSRFAHSGFKALALLIIAAACLSAQTARSGAISGTITDPTGAVVPGATVVVHNEDTSADRSLVSNEAGVYSATFLQPGHYEVTASKTGFNKSEHQGILLEVGRSLSIDFAFTVQAGAEAVTVSGEAPIVDNEKTEVSQQVGQNLIENLPIVGRRWDNFALLTPGATTDGNLVSYRGISGLYNNNMVDGANNNQAFFSEARGRSNTTYTYSIDSIQEFQVSTSGYSAEFGQAAGGVINAVTRSGTNGLHGDLFYFLRYPSLNALDPINKASGIFTQPVRQQQQFGGSVGGPVIKDKLFYFFTYDGSRRVFPISYTSTAYPTASSPDLPCPTAVTAAQCAAANAYLKSLVNSYPRTGTGDVFFGKLDYQVNSGNHLSGAFDWNNYHAPNDYNPATTVNNNSVTNNGTLFTKTRIFVGNWDSVITNAMVNNVRFQWGVDNEIAGANGGGPQVAVTNVTQYGLSIALPRPAFPDEHRLQFTDTLSWIKGKHQIKFGYDFNAIHELLINLFQGGGSYSYTGANAFGNWVADTVGANLGDGLTGRHFAQFQQVNDPITGAGKDDFYDNDFAGFVEDSWKFRSNLTFNLGVRYEIQTIPQPPRPNTLTPLTTLYTSTINTDSNNFAPRLGFAYSPMKGTVIRAGYGIFYGKTSNSTWYAMRVENGVFQQSYTCLPSTCPGLTFPNLLFTPPGPPPAAPFPGALTPQVTPFSLPLATQLVHGVQPDFVNPLIHEGDLTIEKELPGHMSFSAGYVFSRGLHLPSFVDANIAPATTTHTYDVLNSAGAVVTKDTEPFYTTRLNPQTGPILVGKSNINSWYNAAVLTLRKPMSHGIEVLINYTYAKSLDDGAVAGAAGISGTFFGTVPTIDPYNQKRENSVSDLDQRHRFVGSLVYEPRFTKISNKIASAIVNGYSFSMVSTLAGRQPLPSSLLAISGFPSGGVDSGLTGGTLTYTGGTTGGRPPWLGRNVYFGHPLYNFDVRLAREFRIVEKVRLAFQLEAFNVFNHTNIFSVNNTPYTFTNVGSGACTTALAAGTNGCLIPSPTFELPTTASSSNGLYGARQLQISAKITF